jgi:hypothetical protein
MEDGTIGLSIVNDALASATRDIEVFARKQHQAEEALAKMFTPITESFSNIVAPIIAQQAEMQRCVTEMLAPSVRAAEEIARIMQPHLEHAARMQEMMEGVTKGISFPTSISEPFGEEVVYIPRPEPTVVRLDRHSVDLIVEKVVTILKTERSATDQQKEVLPPKPSIDLPDGATWNDVELRLADIYSLRVLCKRKLIGQYDYAALGFDKKNTRDRTPDKQWGLLVQLAVMIETKKVKPTIGNLSHHLGIKSGACEKLKASLSKKLQAAFGISSDPFLKYDAVEGYRPKFTLRPESLLRGTGELHSSGKEFHEDTYNEEDLIEQFAALMDTVDLHELGIKEVQEVSTISPRNQD